MNYADFLVYGMATVAVGSVLWSARSLYSNNRTYKDRMVLIDACRSHRRMLDFYEEFERIDYDAHFKEVMWFRNPWKLYSVKLIDFLRHANAIDHDVWVEARAVAYMREKQALDITQMAISEAESAQGSNTAYRKSRNG